MLLQPGSAREVSQRSIITDPIYGGAEADLSSCGYSGVLSPKLRDLTQGDGADLSHVDEACSIGDE